MNSYGKKDIRWIGSWVAHAALGVALGVALCCHLNTLSINEGRKSIEKRLEEIDFLDGCRIQDREKINRLIERVYALELKDYELEGPKNSPIIEEKENE